MSTSSLPDIIKKLCDFPDRSSRTLFYEMTHKRLYKYCLILSHQSELADDLLHDTYIKAFRNIVTLKNPEKCQAWLCTIARNLYFDQQKRAYKKRETQIFDENTSLTEMPPKSSRLHSTAIERFDLIATLEQLPSEDREILYLVDMEGADYRSAGEILNLSESAVKSRIHRARKKFINLYNSETNPSAKSSKT